MQGAGKEKAWRTRWAGAAVLLYVLAATTALAPSAIASRHHVPRPQLSWAFPHAIDEGEPIPFSWSGRHLGKHHKLVVQRPVGTAHVWKTIMRLPSDRGSTELPGMPLGRYRLRIADIALVPRQGRFSHRRYPRFRVLTSEGAGIGVFGKVPFSTLFNSDEHEHVYTGPGFSFPYVAGWNSLNAEADGNTTVFKVDHSNCLWAHIDFVSSTRGTGTGTLTLVQESREAVSATAPFDTIGSLDAELTPGQSWAATIEYKSSDQREVNVYVNGYAVCDSTEPFN
jgi:hypothetical protein